MADRVGHWFQTWSGRRFYPANPRPEDVFPADIAHALARICRFAGHVVEFCSVAQHSVLVSELVPPHLALHGLLHDAAEAYVGDLISPMKWALRDRSQSLGGSAFDQIERGVERAILQRFDLQELPEDDSAIVKHADLRALATERRDLLRPSAHIWECLEGIEPDARVIVPIGPRTAEAEFLDRLDALLAQGALP